MATPFLGVYQICSIFARVVRSIDCLQICGMETDEDRAFLLTRSVRGVDSQARIGLGLATVDTRVQSGHWVVAASGKMGLSFAASGAT